MVRMVGYIKHLEATVFPGGGVRDLGAFGHLRPQYRHGGGDLAGRRGGCEPRKCIQVLLSAIFFGFVTGFFGSGLL